MATQPLGALTSLNFENPKDSALNTAGMSTPEQEQIMNAREDALSALEQRYAQPNWFKVAAGFAKPQLGGFLASLGSASEAMGENVEQQRAMAVPIAVERAKLQQMKSMISKNERGADLTASLLGLGEEAGRKMLQSKDLGSFITRDNIDKIPGAIGRLRAAGQTDFADALKAAQDSYRNQIESRVSETNLSAEEQARIKADPSYVPKYPDSLPIGSKESQDRYASDLRNTLAARGADPEQLKTASINQLLTMSQQAMEAQAARRLEDLNVSSDQASQAKQRLLSLAESRELVSSPSIGKVLGLPAGQTAFSAMLGYINNMSPEQGAALQQALAQLKITDQKAYDDFQVLQKLLMQDVQLTRSTMQNPSVSSTLLASKSNPTVQNSQAAILKMMDLMAHKQSETYREYVLKSKYKGDFNKLQASGEIEKLHDQLLAERRELARTEANAKVLPSFYSLSAVSGRNNEPSNPAAPSTPVAPGAASTNVSPARANTGAANPREAVRAALRARGYDPDKVQ